MVLNEFINIVVFDLPNGLSPSHGPDIDHKIELVPSGHPVSQQPYRFSLREEDEQLQVYVSKGFEPNKSLWGAPILLVRKEDNMMHLYVDYKGLNKVIMKNKYLFPHMDELMDRPSGVIYFTKIGQVTIKYI